MKKHGKYLPIALCALLFFAILAFVACAPADKTAPSSSSETSSSVADTGGEEGETPDDSSGAENETPDDSSGAEEETPDDTSGAEEQPAEDTGLPGGLVNGGNFSGNHT